MTKEELAIKLNGNNGEMSKQDEKLAEENGLVVVYGCSDDLMEFRGAIYDEVSCYDGDTAYLDANGILESECDDDDCPYFTKLKEGAKTIEAIWCENDDVSWSYKTDITHATFNIMKNGELYCIGIVFSINDLK
jgi:hypothetical protein